MRETIGNVRCQKPAEALHPYLTKKPMDIWCCPDERALIFYFNNSVGRREPIATVKLLGLT